MTQSVTAKALTVSGITAASTIYDGTTTAKLGGTAAFLATEAAGAGTTADGKPYNVDTVSPGTVTGTLAARTVGSEAVTTVVTVTGTGNGNYTVTSQAGLTQTVTAKALTAQGTLSGGGKVYNGLTTTTPTGSAALQTAEATGSSTADGKPYTGDTVSLTGTASYNFNSKDVASATTITESGLSLTGAQATNYTLTAPTLSATITAKALNYTGISANNKTADGGTAATFSGSAAALSAEAPGGGSTSDGEPYTGDTVSFLTGTLTGMFASASAGTGIAVTLTGGVTLSGAQSGDYSVGSPSPALTANITAAAAAQLVYTSVPGAGTVGTAFSVTVQSQDAYGNPASPTSNTTITLSKASGAGTLSGTLTGTILTSGNSVTISTPVYSTPDTMTLTATATGGMTSLTPVTSGNIVFSATFGVTTVGIPNSTVGNNTTDTQTGAGNYFVADPFTTTVPLTATTIYTYGTNAGNVQITIYNDNSGSPGSALFSAVTYTSTASGWSTVTIPNTYLPAGKYWVVYNLNSSSAAADFITKKSVSGYTRKDIAGELRDGISRVGQHLV